MEKYDTLYLQAERIDTEEAYEERDKIYKSMDFGDIMCLINEIKEISELMSIRSHEFNLNTSELSVISNELRSIGKVGDCLSTIAQLRSVRGI